MSKRKTQEEEPEQEEEEPDFASDEDIEAYYAEQDAEYEKMAKGEYMGEIVGIELGILGDFIDPEKLKKKESASRKVINIHIKTPIEFEPQYTIRKTLTLTKAENSSMVKYERRFGSRPKVGMNMPLFFDTKKGFWDVNL